MGLRLAAAAAAILLLSGAAHAGLADVLTAAINKCAAITDDATRHACYDQLPTLLKTPVAAAEAPAPVAAPASPPPVAVAAQPPATASANAWADEEKRSMDNGFDILGPEPVPTDHIAATVDSFTYDYGVFVVTLDNGQVWRQVTPAKGFIPLSKDNKAQVTIWRSRFGYDVLKIRGYHPTYHVRRIK